MTDETLRALAKKWGIEADRLVRAPQHSKAARLIADAEVMTLRHCERQLIEALAELRAKPMR